MKNINSISKILITLALTTFSISAFATENISRCLKPTKESVPANLPKEICINTVDLVGGPAGVRSMTMSGKTFDLATTEVVPLTNQNYTIATFKFSKSRKIQLRIAFVPEFNRATKTWSIGNWNSVKMDLVYPSDARACFLGAGCTETLPYQ